VTATALPPTATETLEASPTAGLELTATSTLAPTPTLDPEAWKSLPVVPVTVSPEMVAVYQRGLAMGRDPNRFSKIGDCQNIPVYFLSSFDNGNYRLGDQYSSLQPTIDHFAGSWSRESLAVKGGMNVAAVLNPYSIFKDTKQCLVNESPLACEIRVYDPSIVTISMETWWEKKPASEYEKYMRQIVEYVLSQNVVPILATKADNLEGDYGINAAIARVAYDYHIPLWNYWAATYSLPAHGLTADEFHLTLAGDYFDDTAHMKNAWPWRNLTALQSIDAVYRALNSQSAQP
jgi:hypothetical protein